MPSEFDYIKTANRWRRYSEDYFKEARDIFLNLSRNLVTLATFLFILGATILQFSETDNLSPINKAFLITSWLSMLFSIVSGLYLSFKSNGFLNAIGTAYEDKANNLIKYVVETQKAGGLEFPTHLHGELSYNFSLWPFYIQSATFILGFILTLLFGATILSDCGGING